MTRVAAVAAICASAGVAAMAAQEAMGKSMDASAPKRYTGCVTAGSTPGTFTLTHASEAMKMDGMSKDMPKDAGMKKDAMKGDAMKTDAMPMGDHDMGKTFVLAGKNIDFAKHVGHEVSVTGTEPAMSMDHDAMAKRDGMSGGAMKTPPTLSVTTFKMVAGTCKM